MNSLPSAFISRIRKQLGMEADVFFQSLELPPPVSIRLNPRKTGDIPTDFLSVVCGESVKWCKGAYYLNSRPVFTLDPCFHGGAYYVQEASSMFLAHVLKQIMPPRPLRVLDLCAAPGGKSTLIASLLPAGSLLVSNEVIRSRASVLKENIIKWGEDHVVVTNNDPSDFTSLQGAFDMILVDAPCSGEGMFRKDEQAVSEWNESNTRICSERQKRILTDIRGVLKPGGYLIYSTCTYNPEENERISEWIIENFRAESVAIEHGYPEITPGETASSGYHFYPHKTVGEGFFISVFQVNEGVEFKSGKEKKGLKAAMPRIPEEIANLLPDLSGFAIRTDDYRISILPVAHADFIRQLEKQLRVLYQGCEVAELNNRKLKLLPPLALYQGLKQEACRCYEADLKTALKFLKKEDIAVTAPSGEWVLISHKGVGLGWGKSVGNRLNNYFPKEWRIRMRINEE